MSQEAIYLIAAFIAVAVYVAFRESNRRKKRMLRAIRESWGKPSGRQISDAELEVISHYYLDCVDGKLACDEKDYIDDITWNDLSMDTLFRRMNTCFSSVGQEYLYKLLRLPFNDVSRLQQLDRLADAYKEKQAFREDVLKIFYRLGFARKISISDYAALLMDLEPGSNIVHYLSIALIIVSCVVTFGFNALVGLFMIIASVAYAIISYYSYKAKVEPYFICMFHIVRMTGAAKELCALDDEALSEYKDRLSAVLTDMTKVTRNSWLLASSNENGSIAEMVLDYLRMITHVDLIRFNSSLKNLKKCQNSVYELISTLGFMEAAAAVSSFRESIPYWSRPEFKKKGAGFSLDEVYHPCVDNAVANSIAVNGNVLLTGSNASGKSTFLKTVAINAILAQSIYTSVARSYDAPMYRVYSSMALKDNLEGHDSYYIVEIKSLKRIIDRTSEDGLPVLCFVDEVLRGTNTVERIAASSQILKSMSSRNVVCFAATHDIELTRILEGEYANYHFQEDFNDDVVFSYKLKYGPATSRNAIRLLKSMGYDEKLTLDAERMADRFLKTGDWC